MRSKKHGEEGIEKKEERETRTQGELRRELQQQLPRGAVECCTNCIPAQKQHQTKTIEPQSIRPQNGGAAGLLTMTIVRRGGRENRITEIASHHRLAEHRSKNTRKNIRSLFIES